MRFDTQWVTLYAADPCNWRIKVRAKKDTGATRCSIDLRLAEALGLEQVGEVLVKNAMGRQLRPLFQAEIRIASQRLNILMSGANRENLSTPMLIGKDILDILAEEKPTIE